MAWSEASSVPVSSVMSFIQSGRISRGSGSSYALGLAKGGYPRHEDNHRVREREVADMMLATKGGGVLSITHAQKEYHGS